MNKIIFFIIVVLLCLGNSVQETFAQKESKNFTDTLIVGGFYRVQLTNGKQFTGEITYKSDSTIDIQTELENFRIKNNRIRSISVAKSDFDESDIEDSISDYDENKFNFLSSFLAGINLPTGDFGKTYKSGLGIQMTAYHLFSSITGFGAELQYNNFPGSSYTYADYIFGTSNHKETWGNYYLYLLKVNFIAGNLNRKNKFVYYGLIGTGIQYYNEGDRISTRNYYDPYSQISTTTNSSYPQESNAAFVYGVGIGGFYKVSKKFGINFEIQFDKAPSPEYDYYSDYESGVNGYFSIKAGIVYTKF